jgi:hypothetical protein
MMFDKIVQIFKAVDSTETKGLSTEPEHDEFVQVDATATATIAALAETMYDNANLPLVNRTRTDLVVIVAGQQPILQVRPLHPELVLLLATARSFRLKTPSRCVSRSLRRSFPAA